MGERLARPYGTPLPRVYGTGEGGQEEAAPRAAQAHGRTREALADREARTGRALAPEETSGRISEEWPDLAAGDSAIYHAVGSESPGCGLPGHRNVARLLRHHGKRRNGKGGQERRAKVRMTHGIPGRPEEASSGSRTGGWEGDAAAGRQGGACLVTQVDRMSGCLVGGKAARKANVEVNEVTPLRPGRRA